MSVWQRGPLTVNPYVRTAFRVTRVAREVTARPTLARLVAQARQVVTAAPTLRTIAGMPVNLEELNTAEAVIMVPEKRILEELLVHATEPPPLKQIRRLMATASEALATEANPSAVTNPKALGVWLDDLASRCWSEAAAPEWGFGALETHLVAPMGEEGEL